MNPLSNLNPQFLKLAAVVLGALLLASLASYFVPACQRKADIRTQAQVKKERAASVASNQQATDKYRLDSAKYAERAWLLRQKDSLLHQQDAHLSSTYKPYLLPAAEQLPHEGANR